MRLRRISASGRRRPVVQRITSAWSGTASATTATGVVALSYPADANVINIKSAPYNAVGNGIADDTAAIQAAFNDWDWIGLTTDPNPALDRSAPKTIYFPAGTYRVTASLVATGSTLRLVGAGRNLTTIKLSDNNAGFQTGTTGYLLRMGEALQNGQENAGFANYIHHMTLDIGVGNPAAIGCRYSVANIGSMRHVTIKSSDPAKVGLRGLMFGSSAGPGYVADVTIDGFDNGIYTETSQVNNIDFSDVTLINQRVTGVRVTAKSLAFENLTISGAPLAIDVTTALAAIVVDGLTVNGPGSGPAINLAANAYAWVRDVTASGWTNLITQGGTARFTGRTAITEWGAVNYRRGTASTVWGENSGYAGLHLPRTRPPVHEQYDHTKWAKPQSYGFTSGDVTTALQQAIDTSGAEVIYLPYGAYTISGTVTLRSTVRKLEGMCSTILGAGTLIVGNNSSGYPIIVQNITPTGTLTIRHDSTNTAVIADIGNRTGNVNPIVETGTSATGNLFVESVGASAYVTVNRPVNAFLRQINREHASCDISGGATVRIFGDNMEVGTGNDEGVVNVTGSTTEVIGAAFDVLNRTDVYTTLYGFNAVNSTISVVIAGYLQSSTVPRWVNDVQSGTQVGQVLNTHEYVASGTTNRRVVVPMYRSP